MDETELIQRINNALEIVQDGNPFKVGDLYFITKDENSFSIIGWTVKNDLKNVTKQSALNELNDIKSIFNRMVILSPELSEFICNRELEFNLGYDYGMSGFGICSEIEGQLKWEIELKE